MKRAVILFTLIFFFLEIDAVFSTIIPQRNYPKDDTIKINGNYKICVVYEYSYDDLKLDSNSKRLSFIYINLMFQGN